MERRVESIQLLLPMLFCFLAMGGLIVGALPAVAADTSRCIQDIKSRIIGTTYKLHI